MSLLLQVQNLYSSLFILQQEIVDCPCNDERNLYSSLFILQRSWGDRTFRGSTIYILVYLYYNALQLRLSAVPVHHLYSSLFILQLYVCICCEYLPFEIYILVYLYYNSCSARCF